jgi:hypothetical protein
MNQVFIFCESYGQIKYALQLIKRNWADHPVTVVIPGLNNLFQFFQVINEKLFQSSLNLIYLEGYRKRIAQKANMVKKAFLVIPDIFSERRYLKDVWNKNFAVLRGCQVYFISQGSSGLRFYLLRKMSVNNTLIYVSHPPPYLSQYAPEDFIERVNLVIARLIYGRDLAVSEVATYKGFLYVPDKFLKKRVHKIIEGAETEELLRDFDLSKFRVFDSAVYNVIYFDDNLVGSGYIADSTAFKQELNDLFNILLKYFPEQKIAYKYHPGYTGDKTMIKVGREIPSYIPAELLYNNKTLLYLSGFSWSIAHVENGLVVSVGNLITLKSEKDRDSLKQMLVRESKSTILFPESLDEFERILIDITLVKATKSQ